MPVQRRTKWLVAGTMGASAVSLALGVVAWTASRGGQTTVAPTPPAAGAAESPLAGINERIRRSDTQALGELQAILVANKPGDGKPRKALSDAEAVEWIATLTSLRAGFLKFATPGRATTGLLTSLVLDKFTAEPCPANWVDALRPTHDIMSACMSDSESVVRMIGLNEVANLWAWMPGRSLVPAEEHILGDWKQHLHQPVVRCLASRETATRISAISCLGKLPIDEAAAPAVPYVEDLENLNVRKQTLVSFAQRPALLTEEMLLKRIHDPDMSIRETVLAVLKARGLNSEQITLGSLIFHPKPELRLSVIPQLKERTDIDPAIWLLELSHDPVDAVRIGAIRALGARKSRSTSVSRRLAEMAKSDHSLEVRQAARKVLPPADESTASLPPLPGSSALNPRAN